MADPLTPTVQQAVRAIAATCDGAWTEDGVGFNGRDTGFGKSLAGVPDELWTPKMLHSAWRMVRTYRGQLATIHGIDFDQIPEPPDPTAADYLPPPEDKPERTIELDDGVAVIRSEYDRGLVAEVRALPGRRWNAADKVNTVPTDSDEGIVALHDFATRNGFDYPSTLDRMREAAAKRLDEADGERDLLSEMASAVHHEPFTIPGLDGELRPYQYAAVAYIEKTRRTFICDEMGTGKTVMSLAAIQHLNAYPALVVAPVVAKSVWRRHVEEWLPGRTVEVGAGRKPPDGWTPTADVTILNYDILKGWKDAFPRLGALVLDESHYVKNPQAARSKHCGDLAACVAESGLVLLLTGTPVMNRPSELVMPLRIMGQFDQFGTWHKFVTRYCGAYRDRFGWNLDGAAHLDELNREMRKRCYIRRTKDQVLKDLPPKTWATLDLDDHPAAVMAEYRTAEADVVRYLSQRAAEIAEELGKDPRAAAVQQRLRAQSAEHLVMINTLRQLAAKCKMRAVKAWVADFLEGSDEKVILFAHHKEVVRELVDEFGCPSIDGGVSNDMREQAEEVFQNDPDCRVIVCSIRAAGVALTLTAASNVLFVEHDWSPAIMDQAADRTHRIGQDKPVTAWMTVASGTVDHMIVNLLAEKRKVIDAAVDGVDLESGGSILGDMVVELASRSHAS